MNAQTASKKLEKNFKKKYYKIFNSLFIFAKGSYANKSPIILPHQLQRHNLCARCRNRRRNIIRLVNVEIHFSHNHDRIDDMFSEIGLVVFVKRFCCEFSCHTFLFGGLGRLWGGIFFFIFLVTVFLKKKLKQILKY